MFTPGATLREYSDKTRAPYFYSRSRTAREKTRWKRMMRCFFLRSLSLSLSARWARALGFGKADRLEPIFRLGDIGGGGGSTLGLSGQLAGTPGNCMNVGATGLETDPGACTTVTASLRPEKIQYPTMVPVPDSRNGLLNKANHVTPESFTT